MITACVPSVAVAEALAGIERAAEVDVLVWEERNHPPEGLERVEFLVPPYMAGPLPAEALAGMPRLRVVQLLSAGYDQWQSLVPVGVTLCNGRGIHGGSTAELAVGGLIAVLREIPRFHDQQRAGRWDPHRAGGLDGKRVLVLGAGDIGARVATAVGAFGAQATLVGRTARPGVQTLDEVPALLPEHEVVVVALPYTPQTDRLVDAAFLARMPDGACLVNVARGAIVDTGALLAELTARRLSAFLDVTDPEPLPEGHPLWQAPNLLLTPHVGGGTRGWDERANRLVRAQLERFVAGEPLANVVS